MPQTLVNSPTSFSLTRTLDAPRETVFNAWTNPLLLREWWAPPGFTCPSADIDLRPGGKYRLGMKPPEGDVYYLSGEFVEIKPPEKLVYTWAWEEDDGPGHESLVTVEFRSQSDKTEIVITQERLASAESRDKHIEGWAGCLDQLINVVKSRTVTVSVAIDAPAAAVFRALTDDRELERWWPTEAKSDLRVGGKYMYSFQFEDPANNLDQDGVFVEITPNSRLRYTWPATEKDVLTDVRFDIEEVGASSVVSLLHTGFEYGSEWDASLQGHTSGWNGFLQNLKSVLEGGPDVRKSAMAMKTRA